MKTVIDGSTFFGREGAAKHFVALSYDVVKPGQARASERKVASCFVIEAIGKWLLITAGHVVANWGEAVAAGYVLQGFTLIDTLAGSSFPALPIAFDMGDWAVVEGEPEGSDYAALPLRDWFQSGLIAGGVQPISRKSWGSADASYDQVLLVGIPRESIRQADGRLMGGMAIIPVSPTEPPSDVVGAVMGRSFAKILDSPNDKIRLRDVDGMSGGPVFGLRVDADGTIHYWVIGVQSHWFSSKRIISFCPADEFFEAVRSSLQKIQQALPRNL